MRVPSTASDVSHLRRSRHCFQTRKGLSRAARLFVKQRTSMKTNYATNFFIFVPLVFLWFLVLFEPESPPETNALSFLGIRYMRLRYVVYSTPKKHSHLFRPSVLKELRKVSRPLPKHVGNKAAWPMTKRNNPFCSEMSAPLERNNKIPQVYRGPCEVAVQVTGQQLTRQIFTFKTSFFFNEKTVEPKKLASFQHLFANLRFTSRQTLSIPSTWYWCTLA